MRRVQIAKFSELEDRRPIHALVGNVDLVIVRYDDEVSVLYGRCLHRGALLADGHIDGQEPHLRGALLGLSVRNGNQ